MPRSLSALVLRMGEDRAIAFIVDELTQIDVPMAVRLVRFRRALSLTAAGNW